MSSITGLISGGGGGGTPINGIAKFQRNGELTFTDDQNQEWLKSGNLLTSNFSNYPDAIQNDSDLTLASYDNNSYTYGVLTSDSRDFIWNNDGTRFFVAETQTERILQFSLNTPYDLSTAGYDFAFNTPEENGLETVVFNDNGLTMYILGSGTDDIHQYNLGTAFDISTANYVVQADQPFGSPTSMRFNNDGSKLFILSSGLMAELTLSTPYALSSISTRSFSVGLDSYIGGATSFCFSPKGDKLFIASTQSPTSQMVVQFRLAVNFSISGGITFEKSYNPRNQFGYINGVNLSNDGTKMFLLERFTGTLYRYDLPKFIGLADDNDPYEYLRIK